MRVVTNLSAAVILAGLLVPIFAASAQDAKNKTPTPAPNAASLQKPSPAKMLTLIKTSIIAVNQANLANDYSVLYKTSAPGFQSANPEAKLAEIFAKFRELKLDLSPIVLFNPQVKEPQLTEKGYLRLTGFFPTKPVQVNFDLLYENIQGDWKLYGIALKPVPAQTAAQQAPAADQKAAAPAQKQKK